MPERAYHGFESAVPQHLENLSVLLTFFLECKFTLLIADSRMLVTRSNGAVEVATHSFSFFPLRRFLPPFPLFFGMLTKRAQVVNCKLIRFVQISRMRTRLHDPDSRCCAERCRCEVRNNVQEGQMQWGYIHSDALWGAGELGFAFHPVCGGKGRVGRNLTSPA